MGKIEAPKGAELSAAVGIGSGTKKLWQNQRAAAFERLRPALADFHFQSLEAQPESRSERGSEIGRKQVAPTSHLLRRFLAV